MVNHQPDPAVFVRGGWGQKAQRLYYRLFVTFVSVVDAYLDGLFRQSAWFIGRTDAKTFIIGGNDSASL